MRIALAEFVELPRYRVCAGSLDIHWPSRVAGDRNVAGQRFKGSEVFDRLASLWISYGVEGG